MRAFAYLGQGRVGLIEKPMPEAGPLDAIIRTTAGLICTSDVHTVAGGLPLPEGRALGHESVGIVHRVGSQVKRFKEGDRIAVNAATPCGCCDGCQRGFPSQCGGMLGAYKFTAQKDGSLAEYFHVNDADYNLAIIPDSLTDEQALYTTDMMSTGFAGAERARIPMGGSIAIFAQGPVGLCATMGARLCGAGLIITVESRPERAALSRHFGADLVIDPLTEDPVRRIMELTGDGVDSAIEALGQSGTFAACVKVTRPGGVIANVSYHEAGIPLTIPTPEFGLGMSDKAIHAVLCVGGRVRTQRLLQLIATGKVDPTPLTTHRFSFNDVEKAFHLMAAKGDGIIKPLIQF